MKENDHSTKCNKPSLQTIADSDTVLKNDPKYLQRSNTSVEIEDVLRSVFES